MKIRKKEAERILFVMWENGEIPSNFTEDHSEYNRAVECIMINGYLISHEFF
jgi:hypothetical protein